MQFKTLIINKLAACVNVIEQVNSYYIWEEKLTTSSEKLLIIKTKFSSLVLIVILLLPHKY